MYCLFKQKELNDVVIDVEIIAIGDKEHCLSKAYYDYKLNRFHDPEWSVYKLRKV